MAKPRHQAEVVKERGGAWAVKITLSDGSRVMARPGTGSQKVVYDKPERVPRHLKHDIVPKLIEQARLKNLSGDT